MPVLLVRVMLFQGDHFSKWPPDSPLDTDSVISLNADEALKAAEWCQEDITDFVRVAIRDRLNEVQAAMEEERIGES